MMKIIFFLLIFIAGSFQLNAQIKNSIVTDPPNYISTDGKMLPLEMVVAKMKKYKIGDKTQVLVIEQEHASMSIPAADTLQLVVNTSTDLSSIDPSMIFHLYHLNINDGNREAAMAQKAGYGKKGNNDRIAYLLKTYADKLLFSIIEKLPPGEYAFINMLSMNKELSVPAFCFRIE